jgi:serine-type D-Ala-D-Ala carboxypeptidase (penicillin-binding protein 5/6)
LLKVAWVGVFKANARRLVWLIFALGLFAPLRISAKEAWPLQTEFASAIVLSVNGKVLLNGHADKRLPPASLTKLLAALVLIENPKLNAWVTISERATQQEGTKLRFKKGEEVQAAYLLGAMLIYSANDACAALAEWDAGSEAAFVKKMNAKVAAMKLKNTHFENACGFDGAAHFSSANDLVAIAQAANQEPKIKVWTDLPRFAFESRQGRKYDFATSNLLLGRVVGVDGLKTGFTQKAGKCLIAHGKRNGREVYLVMLNAKERWWDADALLNWAFDEALK